jgi:hypothetical protein
MGENRNVQRSLGVKAFLIKEELDSVCSVVVNALRKLHDSLPCAQHQFLSGWQAYSFLCLYMFSHTFSRGKDVTVHPLQHQAALEVRTTLSPLRAAEHAELSKKQIIVAETIKLFCELQNATAAKHDISCSNGYIWH